MKKYERIRTRVSVMFILLCAMSVYTLSSVCAQEGAQENVPSGYTMKWANDIKVGLLVPDGWHVTRDDSESAKSLLITKEDIAVQGSFKTGFTVIIIPDIDDRADVPPSEYAEFFVNNMKNVTDRSWDIKPIEMSESCSGSGGFFESKSDTDGTPIVQYIMAVGNDTTGTVYIVQYVSTKKDWAQNWTYGQTILNHMELSSKL